jgi:hypothetical protein
VAVLFHKTRRKHFLVSYTNQYFQHRLLNWQKNAKNENRFRQITDERLISEKPTGKNYSRVIWEFRYIWIKKKTFPPQNSWSVHIPVHGRNSNVVLFAVLYILIIKRYAIPHKEKQYQRLIFRSPNEKCIGAIRIICVQTRKFLRRILIPS